MQMKKRISMLFIACLCTFLLCGYSALDSKADNADDLQEYTVEEVGVFYLPEGFKVNSGKEEEPLPTTWAEFTKGDMTIRANRFGTDAYESAGVPLPKDLEEYSQRDGVRRELPEDVEFSENEYEDLFVTYTNDDDLIVYNVLKKGTESYGAITAYYPEGTEGVEDIAFWISQCTLE